MKPTPSDRALAQRLAGSKFSGRGFLGHDTRPIDRIVEDDARTLKRLGVRPGALAGRLLEVYLAARGAMGASVEVAPGVSAVFHESMGRIPSPFRGDGVFEKGEALVTGSGGETLRITRLGIELIRKHAFFQGLGAPFRIDPERAVRLLGPITRRETGA